MFENDSEFDVTKLKAKGIAYIGITADAKAAEKKGCSWKVLDKEKDPTREEDGLLWDIISQTAEAAEDLLGERPSKLYLGIRRLIMHVHIPISMYLIILMDTRSAEPA